jgi:hypothetical protein
MEKSLQPVEKSGHLQLTPRFLLHFVENRLHLHNSFSIRSIDEGRNMIYVRSFLGGLLTVTLLILLSGFINIVRKVFIYVITKTPGGFEMDWDLTAVRGSPILWVLIFFVFAVGFCFEFYTLSH